jgi:hypothetical protein
MINQNIKIEAMTSKGPYMFACNDPELSALLKKYDDEVYMQISKPMSPGSEAQNRAAHALMAGYFATGLHSSPAKNIAEFKLYCKLQWGPTFYWEYQGQACRVPKSWASYSKQERQYFIDCLLADIHQSGAAAESEKIQEILKGLDDNSKLAY